MFLSRFALFITLGAAAILLVMVVAVLLAGKRKQ